MYDRGRERGRGRDRDREGEVETHLEDRTHGVRRGSSQVGAELVESLQVGLMGHNSKCLSVIDVVSLSMSLSNN